MSSIFEEAYKEFTLDEVIYRLPSELATKEFKRRVKTAEDILEILKVREAKDAANEITIKQHINEIIANMPVEDFLKIDEQYHPRMFKWLDNTNTKRIKDYGVEYISTKLLFNITQPDEVGVWEALLDKSLKEVPPNRTHIARIAEKIDSDYFGNIINVVLADPRPEVKSSLLKIGGSNVKYLTEQNILVALKAYAKCPLPDTYDAMRVFDWEWLKQLKAQERFFAIKNYLAHMPEFQKIQVFKNMPTFEEFRDAIFPASIQFNEEFNQLLEQYSRITRDDAPEVPEDTEEDDQSINQTTIATPAQVTQVPAVVAKVDQLNAADWYFQDDYIDEDEMDTFTFVRKSSWDADNKLDEELSENELAFLEATIKAAGIGINIMPCVYQCNGNDVESAVSYLKSQGFTKKRCVKK